MCPFCDAAAVAIEETALVRVLVDAFPVSPGHALIVPRRHVVSPLEMTTGEAAECWAAIARHAKRLGRHGYNVGANIGRAAGQTVEHAHIHVIPRDVGDTQDPRGGIRGVIPGKRIWETST